LSEAPDSKTPATYADFAGRDLGRIAGLSDGIFGVAMTLLILDIHTPESGRVATEWALLAELAALAPKFLTWILSALTLGIFWLGQQAQLDNLAKSDRNLSWLHYLFLGTVTLLPFSTRLLSEFFDYRVALIVYWANILACGASLFLCWRYAERAGLVRPDAPPALDAAVRRRIFIAQALYFVAATIGLAKPVVGIVLIIALQLTYAFSLPLPRRWRH